MNKLRIYFVLGSFWVGSIAAQENESIGIQEVLVVKSYTPSLSDAFKIKSSPVFPDSLAIFNKNVEYVIKAVPVVSTFEPNKASPLKLQQRKSMTPYNTFFSGGLGNKNQLYFNVSSVIELDRTQRFGVLLYRDGFGRNVNNTLLNSNQNHSHFGLNHNFRSYDYNANTQLQYTTNNNNYFGLYNINWDDLIVGTINPEIKRNFFKFRTQWNWYDSVLRGITFQADLNSDNFNSTEQQLALESDFEVELGRGKIKVDVQIKGLNTGFDTSFFEKNIEEYTQGLGTLDLYWQNNRNALKFKIGAGATYVTGVDQISSPFMYYPKVELFYQKLGNSISPFLKAEGGVHLNAYKNLAESNPYLAPTTPLLPTFNQYNARLGIRSSLASVLNFEIGLWYDQIENFSYFERLPFDVQNQNLGYRFSNSFQSQYANTDLYGFNATIRIDLAKNNFVRFETFYRFFEVDGGQTLWNTPALEMNWESQFKWNDRVVFSLNGNLYGDRKAAVRNIFLEQDLTNAQISVENLPLFIRSTAHVTYKISEQFDFFVKGRFNTKGMHGRWAFYPEPPLLLLGGMTYKFDFQY